MTMFCFDEQAERKDEVYPKTHLGHYSAKPEGGYGEHESSDIFEVMKRLALVAEGE